MIIVNEHLPNEERAWAASNGVTRRNLVVVNKLNIEIPANTFVKGRVGVLDKGNHSFIFLNKPKLLIKKRAIVLNRGCGFDILNEQGQEVEPLYSASSIGGYGNSKSKMAILDGDKVAYIQYHTYKMRHGYIYEKYIPSSGFKDVGVEELPWTSEEIQEV